MVLGAFALACLLVAARPAQAQLAVVTLRSLDAVMEDARYVLTLAGQEETARQLDGIIAAFTGGKGFQGVDTKKPLGIYVDLPKDGGLEPPAVLFVPVTRPADLLDLLKALNVPVGEPNKGVHSVDLPTGQTFYLKFENEHAYLTNKKELLGGKLPNPADFLNAANRSALLAATLRLDSVPDNEKVKFLQELEGFVAQNQERQPDESEAAHQGRLAGMAFAKAVMTTLVQDAKELTLALTIDKTKHVIDVDLTLTPRVGSPLAKRFQSFGAARSVFSGWAADSAMNILVAVPIADDLRKELGKVIEKAFQAALEQEKDPKQKALAQRVYQTFLPSLQSESLDGAMAIYGPRPDKLYSMVLGLKVKEGKKIEGLLRDLAKELPPEERKALKLDTDRVGAHSVHRITPPADDAELTKHFGANEIYLLFRDDVVLLALGKHAKETLQDALNRLDRGVVVGTAPIQMEMSLSRLAPLAPDDAAQVQTALKKVFTGEDSDKDRIRLSLTGGDSLRLRLEVSTLLIKVGAMLAGQAQ